MYINGVGNKGKNITVNQDFTIFVPPGWCYDFGDLVKENYKDAVLLLVLPENKLSNYCDGRFELIDDFNYEVILRFDVEQHTKAKKGAASLDVNLENMLRERLSEAAEDFDFDLHLTESNEDDAYVMIKSVKKDALLAAGYYGYSTRIYGLFDDVGTEVPAYGGVVCTNRHIYSVLDIVFQSYDAKESKEILDKLFGSLQIMVENCGETLIAPNSPRQVITTPPVKKEKSPKAQSSDFGEKKRKVAAEKAEKERAKREQEEAEKKRIAAEKKAAKEKAEKEEAERKRKVAEEKAAKEAAKQAELEAAANKLRPRFAYASGLISSSGSHIVAVKQDGTVVATGKNDYGQCDVGDWRNVVSVHCDRFGTVAVTSTGRVYYTGSTLDRQGQCQSWTGIKAAGIADHCVIGLKYDGTVVATSSASTGVGKTSTPDVTTWTNIERLIFGASEVAGVTKDGQLLHVSRNCYQRCESTFGYGVKDVLDAAFGFIGAALILKKDGSVSISGAQLNPPYNPTKLKGKKGIVKVEMNGRQPLALLSDGSLFLEPIPNSSKDDFATFIRSNNIENIIAVCADGISISLMTANGHVYWFQLNSFSRSGPAQPFGDAFQAFSNFHEMMDKKEEEERRILEEKKIAEEKAREEAAIKADWRSKGLCQFCGGTLKKGLFSTKCTVCGKRKDY